jgi:putative DNA primase/helicase
MPTATKAIKPTANKVEDRPKASDVDPAEVAFWFLREKENSKGNRPLIRYWGGSWWGWDTGCWRKLAKQHIESLLLKSMHLEYIHVKRTHVSNAMMHLQSLVALPDGQSPPCWAGGNQWELYSRNLKDCLFTKNSIVYLPDFVTARSPRTCKQWATPALFNTVAADYEFERSPPKPKRWLKFLKELWPDDAESVATLQMLFGYLLTPDTSQHKIFAIIGPKRSGKGTIIRVLRRLVGEGNVAGPSLGELGNEFALQGLLDKTLAVVSDMRLGTKCPSRAIERLLAISGEDKHTVNIKHGPPIDIQLPLRFLLVSNELPRFVDSSKAIVSRLILLRTTQSFFGREDTELLEELKYELPGIVLWAIEGWRLLRRSAAFKQPKSGLELIEQLEDLASPVSTFLHQRCNRGPDTRILKDELYNAWCEWCRKTGHRSGADSIFARDLRAIHNTNISEDRPRSSGGERPRYWTGVSLKPVPR